MITDLVLFGASGDLTGRFVLPALATLRAAGRLPEGFAIVGAGREPWDDEAFRRHVTERLAEHAAGVPHEHRDALTRSLRYRSADVADPDDVGTVVPWPARAPSPPTWRCRRGCSARR